MVVVTGAEDIVADAKRIYLVRNGHPLMAHVVGTGCMATSVIGVFRRSGTRPGRGGGRGPGVFWRGRGSGRPDGVRAGQL